MKSLAIFLGFCFSGTFGAPFYQCYWITSPTVDCDRFTPQQLCGTDLVTYQNKCEFSRAHCADNTLDLRHNGSCTAADGTTPPPLNQAGGDLVFDFMCTSLSHMDCPPGGDPVCATDGRPYDNYCEYEKAKCTHRNIMVVDCTTTNV